MDNGPIVRRIVEIKKINRARGLKPLCSDRRSLQPSRCAERSGDRQSAVDEDEVFERRIVSSRIADKPGKAFSPRVDAREQMADCKETSPGPNEKERERLEGLLSERGEPLKHLAFAVGKSEKLISFCHFPVAESPA